MATRKKKKPQVPAKEFEANKLMVLKAILEIVSTLLKLIRELQDGCIRY